MSKSLAVAYQMKKKSKKMASGGTVESGDKTMNYSKGGSVCKNCGGPVKMSEGGMVANEKGEGVDDLPSEFDDLALRDGLEFKYTGKNSGDDIGGPDDDDIVARAMRRRKR